MCSKHDIEENIRDIFNPDISEFQADEEKKSNWVISLNILSLGQEQGVLKMCSYDCHFSMKTNK